MFQDLGLHILEFPAALPLTAMIKRLAEAGHSSVKILAGQGEEHLGVGLELSHGKNAIRLKRLLSEDNPSPRGKTHSGARGEGPDSEAERLQSGFKSDGCGHTPRGPEARRIGHGHGSPLSEKPGAGGRRNQRIRARERNGPEEIGLDQHTEPAKAAVPGPDPSEQFRNNLPGFSR